MQGFCKMKKIRLTHKEEMATMEALMKENERLNRIMPHVGETCKYQGLDDESDLVCFVSDSDICTDWKLCFNNKWKLRQ